MQREKKKRKKRKGKKKKKKSIWTERRALSPLGGNVSISLGF